MKEIYFAGGCFWTTQKYLDLIDGVISTKACYINGKTEKTKYKDVSKTDHAEAVYVVYNPKIISLEKLLEYYYDTIDPTSLNHQGEDYGRQYRTGIYYKDKTDVEIIINSLEKLQDIYLYPIVIEVEKVKNITIAEEYHQKFLIKNPFAPCHIPNKLFEKVEKESYNISPEAYEIIKGRVIEPAFNNEYYDNFEKGIYVDIKTKTPLFSSKDKYEFECGYPTFSKPIDENKIIRKVDFHHLMFKAELISKDSKNHLGHLFNDGPKELGGKRYCINSASLKFIPKEKMIEEGYIEYLKYL